jgi:hypothetical protein
MKTGGKIGGVWMAAAGLALAGCGGSDSTPAPMLAPVPAPAPAPPPPPSITIAGTAAQGAALGGAAVSVKCGTGTGATTTAASGAYAVTITEGALPCVVKVVGTNGTTYHSLVAGTGNTGTFTANASPLTEMVVSHVGATDPAAFFGSFGSGSSVPATSVTTANTYLQTALAGLTDLTGINPVTDALVVGNALDQKIDAVVAGLAAAKLTVADVTTAIVQNPTAPIVVAQPLAPSATDCAWLKSGTYRVITRTESDPKYRFETVEINAKALTVKPSSENTFYSFTSDGSCQFDLTTLSPTDDTVKLVVSSSGVIVVHEEPNVVTSQRQVAIALPEQTLPVSELAGTWNGAAWLPVNIGKAGTAAAANFELTVDATGQVTALKGCVGLFACVASSGPFGKYVTNSSGGFDIVDKDGAVIGRAFLYKTLKGSKVAVGLMNDNQLNVAVPVRTLVLPDVGAVTAYRSLQINGDNSTSALTEDTITITAKDDSAKTVTRLLASNSRVDMVTYEKPRDGLRYRAGNSCTINNVPANCSEWVQVPLQEMGINLTLSAAPQPTQQFYQITVNKP